jgi:endonuclease YncB( thermonuclease family)
LGESAVPRSVRSRAPASRTRIQAWPAAAFVGAFAIFLAIGAPGELRPLVDQVFHSLAPAEATTGQAIVGRASVIDGDTIDIRDERIRLDGIDAPESRQSCRDSGGGDYRCGQRAALALADRIGQANVSCDVLGKDRYGRHIATCRLGGVNLNEWLVSSGWALAYREYSRAYIAAEAQAKGAGRGMWAGDFVAPWDWRRGNHG